MHDGLKKRRRRSIEAEAEIDGFKLSWQLRSEPQRSTENGHEGLSVSVQRLDGSFRELILEYPILMQKRFGLTAPKFVPKRPLVTAKTVEADIRQAMENGWDPDSRGKPFVFEVPMSHE